jgi:hypothetical protein
MTAKIAMIEERLFEAATGYWPKHAEESSTGNIFAARKILGIAVAWGYSRLIDRTLGERFLRRTGLVGRTAGRVVSCQPV